MVTRLWSRRTLKMGALLSLLALAPEAQSREKWGPFRGQVVDLETGQPVVGAVMVVVWLEIYGVGLTGHRFYDASEALTDAQGRWEIQRLRASFWKLGIQPPTFHLFAPGYAPEADIVTPRDGEVFVHPTVTKMRRLKTREEILQKSRSRPDFVPPEKIPEFIRAINVERRSLGLDEIEPTGRSQ